MHFTGPVFHPPIEQDTPHLQVTVGCSHNKCVFCTMYRINKFSVSPEEEIIEDAHEIARRMGPGVQRILLENANPFVLPPDKLLRIAEIIHEAMPSVKTITCFSSIRDIRKKTVEDLRALHAAGYDELWIGLESGYDPALAQMNKGYTAAEAEEQLRKLEEAGIKYNITFLLGIAGRGNHEINVNTTLSWVNKLHPNAISFMSLTVVPTYDLDKLVQKGEFEPATERELLEEEIMFLENLTVPGNCNVYGRHPFNTVGVSGKIAGKEALIGHIRTVLEKGNQELLDSVIPRVDPTKMQTNPSKPIQRPQYMEPGKPLPKN